MFYVLSVPRNEILIKFQLNDKLMNLKFNLFDGQDLKSVKWKNNLDSFIVVNVQENNTLIMFT